MEKHKHWWQEVPLTISAVQCNLGDDPEWVMDEYVSKQGFNTEQLLHLTAKGHMGNYIEEEFSQRLDSYLKKSRAYGIREIVYYNVHAQSAEVSAEHPDWVQRNADGKGMEAYGTYNLVCVNPNGAFHKNFLKDIKALCAHDIDGIFLDGPVMRDTGCHCDVCRRDFEAKFGHSIYEATREELFEMRIWAVTQSIKEAYELIKSINPEIALYFNNHAIGGEVVGVDARKLYDYVDILGTEGGFHRAELTRPGLWHVSSNMKGIEAIAEDPLRGDKPLVCFCSGNFGGIPYYMHTPAETRICYAQTVANGANVWYGVHFSPSEFMNTESCLAAKEMNEFVLSHKDVFAPSKTCARVALVWSRDTTNFYASSIGESDFVAEKKVYEANRGDHYSAVITAFDMLERAHIQFDVVDEYAIQHGKLCQYDSVIMPELACVSEKTAACIREYVASGGNILGNFDIGVYDEFGRFERKSKLGDVFGLSGEIKTLTSPSIGTAYLYKEKEDELLETLTFFRIPAPVLSAEWEIAPDTEVLMRGNYPCPTVFGDLKHAERYPTVLKHRYGKGCAYYISGDIWETAMKIRNIPDYTNLLRQYCAITSRSVVETDGDGLYEVVLRRQENRFVLHIVNMTGEMERPYKRVITLNDVDFRLDLNGFGLSKEQYSLSSIRGAKLKNIMKDGNKIAFTLDNVREYEIIVIE